jgi:hypothetical protein
MTRDRDIGLAETMLAPPPRRPVWPIVVAAVVLIGGGIGVALWATRNKPQGAEAQAGSAAQTVVVDAGAIAPEPSIAGSPEELLVLERKALAAADEAALAKLLAPKAFAFGFDAGEVASTGPAAAGMLVRRGAQPVESAMSRIGREKDVAWIVDELAIGKRRVMTSQLAFRDGFEWKIAAWHVAELLPNKRAAELVLAGQLPQPRELPDTPDDDHQIFDAFKAAFVSREAFVEAFSDRADAIDVGSAPRELKLGGEAVKKAFRSVNATIRIHDGVMAARVNDRIGWGAANVDYSLSSTNTQTFRVLCVLQREDAGWRIVLAHWTNAGPLP